MFAAKGSEVFVPVDRASPRSGSREGSRLARAPALQLSNGGQARKRLKRWNGKDESIKDLEEQLRDGAFNLDGFLQKIQRFCGI
ncbi:hypothetical protein HPB47_003739 [Ixodes persulcatus]|uniref:Uncharacterized protein n=1 Tax=Ixodes persulcatus TaxID=34615 RepID=A0AC60PHR4_IXOPE|nr:hypothetical protein HPB47_003739 [Ixodes persulcatus]